MDLEDRKIKKRILSLMKKIVLNNTDDNPKYLYELHILLKFDSLAIQFDYMIKILYKYLTYIKALNEFDMVQIERLFTNILKYVDKYVLDHRNYPRKSLLHRLSNSYGIVVPYIKEYVKVTKEMNDFLFDSMNITTISDINNIITQYSETSSVPNPNIVYYRTIRKLTKHLLNPYYNPTLWESTIMDIKDLDKIIKQYVGQDSLTEEYKDINRMLKYKKYKEYRERDPSGKKLKYWRDLLNKNDEYGFEKKYEQTTIEINNFTSDFDNSMLDFIENLIPDIKSIDNDYIAFLIEQFCEKRLPTIKRQLESLPYDILQSIKKALLKININTVPLNKKQTYKDFKKLVKDIQV